MRLRPRPFDRGWSPLPQQAVRFMKQEARLSDAVCWLYTVLIARMDGETCEVTDYSETLQAWSGCSDERELRRRLHTLTCHGLIEREGEKAKKGGPQGAAWRWRTRFLPPDHWAVQPRCDTCTRRLRKRKEQGATPPVLDEKEQGATRPALPERTGGVATKEQGVWRPKNRVSARSITPDVTPDSFPDDVRGSSLDEDNEGAVERLWLAERSRHGWERFTDPAALRVLLEGVREARADGATADDVEAAIRERARDEWSNTREARAWVVAVMMERKDREHRDRALRAAIEQRHRDDERVEAEWQALQREYPGLTRAEIAQRRTAGA